MRFFILIISLAGFGFLKAQDTSFHLSGQDTIRLAQLHFTMSIALKLEEAIVLIEYQSFVQKLDDEKIGLKKQIKTRERNLKNGLDDSDIMRSQLTFLQSRLSGVDSICNIIGTQKSDTAWIDYSIVEKAHSHVLDLVSSGLDNGQLMVLDLEHRLQTRIIKKTGSKKTGYMTGVGLSYYFIEGAVRQFWVKMNWIS